MAKRFIDTNIFEDEWFMSLSKDGKLLWIYFITKCDHAGIIKLNQKLCKMQTDIKNLNTVIKELGNRIISISENLFFIPKFIEFQYPNFPNSKVRQQNSAIEILKKYGLYDENNLTVSKVLSNTYVTVNKELTNTYEHGNGNGNDNDNVNDNVNIKRYNNISINNKKDIYVNSDKLAKEKEVFNNFRKAYPGTKRGNDIEFENFIKKHKDWRDVLPILMERLNYQKEGRSIRKQKGLFVPEWKNLKTWINQRAWEELININE